MGAGPGIRGPDGGAARYSPESTPATRGAQACLCGASRGSKRSRHGQGQGEPGLACKLVAHTPAAASRLPQARRQRPRSAAWRPRAGGGRRWANPISAPRRGPGRPHCPLPLPLPRQLPTETARSPGTALPSATGVCQCGRPARPPNQSLLPAHRPALMDMETGAPRQRRAVEATEGGAHPQLDGSGGSSRSRHRHSRLTAAGWVKAASPVV